MMKIMLFTIDNKNVFSTEKTDFELWQLILVCIVLLMVNFAITYIHWFVQKEAIIEYGYPKAKGKTLRKHIKSFTLLQKIFLSRLVGEAKRPGLYLYFCLICNLLNLVSAIISIFGIVLLLVTRYEGAFSLVVLPYQTIIFCTLVRFIPDIVCLPSERNRYRIRKRKK